MKEMGEGSYVLGVKIIKDRSKRLLGLSHETYIQKMLRFFYMHDYKSTDIHVEKKLSLSLDMCPKTPNEKEQMSKVPYSSFISNLMYAMMCTRPDICHVVGLVSRFQSNPGQKHWMEMKRILRYMKGTSGYVLCY